MVPYKRIGITVKSGLLDKEETVRAVMTILESLGAEMLFDAERCDDLSCAQGATYYHSEEDIDLLIVLGGDGTILRSVRQLETYTVPLVSINRGTVGFLAELEFGEIDEQLPKLLRGEGVIDERKLLRVAAYHGDQLLVEGVALNEAVIAQGTIARLVDLRTTVNGEPLTTFHSDGLIISTPTGSTAYSLSAGGPIVHPSLDAMILTPINPHSFSQKPVVMRADAHMVIEVMKRKRTYKDMEVVLTLDGQIYVPMQPGDIVEVTQDERCVKFLRKKKDMFFGTLREKLKWGERLES